MAMEACEALEHHRAARQGVAAAAAGGSGAARQLGRKRRVL